MNDTGSGEASPPLGFLIDAHLPSQMVSWLAEAGCRAIHTRRFPQGNRTGDNRIIEIAMDNGWVIVTKAHDFLKSQLSRGIPPKLLLITLGNTHNAVLRVRLAGALPEILRLLQHHGCVELDGECCFARNGSLP